MSGKYLVPSPSLIAKIKPSKTREEDVQNLALPDGNQMASRLVDDGKGGVTILYPWLLADIFSIPKEAIGRRPDGGIKHV